MFSCSTGHGWLMASDGALAARSGGQFVAGRAFACFRCWAALSLHRMASCVWVRHPPTTRGGGCPFRTFSPPASCLYMCVCGLTNDHYTDHGGASRPLLLSSMIPVIQSDINSAPTRKGWYGSDHPPHTLQAINLRVEVKAGQSSSTVYKGDKRWAKYKRFEKQKNPLFIRSKHLCFAPPVGTAHNWTRTGD